jgi:hypothetical protein
MWAAAAARAPRSLPGVFEPFWFRLNEGVKL